MKNKPTPRVLPIHKIGGLRWRRVRGLMSWRDYALIDREKFGPLHIPPPEKIAEAMRWWQ